MPAASSYLQDIHASLNNVPCDAIYLDFSKAFDSVPHKEFLLKLWNCGVTSNLWYWIRNYLSCRSQQVCTSTSADSPTYGILYPQLTYLCYTML